MSANVARIDLGTLDAAREIAIDPALRSANLAAIQQQNPAFAARLTEIRPPAHWRLCRTIDDAWNYRVERDASTAEWLGGSAIPQTRAEALLVDCLYADGNVAVCAAEGGFELHWLLRRLAAHRAVFLFERDLVVLAAALSAADFSHDIRTGRLIAMPPEEPSVALRRELDTHCGLAAPSAVIGFPNVDTAWIAQVREACQSVGREIGTLRAAELRRCEYDSTSPRSNPPRHFAFGALFPSPLGRFFVRRVSEAAAQAGLTVAGSAVDGPRSIHALHHARRLTQNPADLAIFVHPGALPLDIAPRTAALHIDELHIPESFAADEMLHLAASPTIASALEAAGARRDRVLPFYWAATAPPEPRDAPGDHVLLIADCPDASCEACRIEQPTHRIIWEQLRKTITKSWENPEIARPEAILLTVERAAGLSIDDSGLRRQFLRLIRHVLIPHVLVERISMTLAVADCGLRIVGRGWNAVDGISCDVQEVPLVLKSQNPDSAPIAAVFAGATDPLRPDMLLAAASGWPMVVHKTGPGGRVSGLDGVFEPEAHYQTFATAANLLGRIAEVRRNRDVAQRRVDRVRDHVREYHTWPVRLRQLATQLGRNGVPC